MDPKKNMGGKRLGRGLNALFGDDEQPNYNVAYAGDGNAMATTRQTNEAVTPLQNTAQTIQKATHGQTILRVPIGALQPSKFQPRRNFNDDALAELATSLQQHGVLQPLLVRALNETSESGAQYEIIAGERRWRAAQTVPLHELPVIVREFSAEQALQIALIENLQREDLNPVEEAAGYQRLLDEYHYTQDDLAQVIGKSRSHISNMLRVMTLNDAIKTMLAEGKITAGHARALVKAKDPQALAELIVRKNLSVRDAEKLAQQEAQKYRGGPSHGGVGVKPGLDAATRLRQGSQSSGAVVVGLPTTKTADVLALEKSISDMLGLVTEIETGRYNSGKIIIAYKDLDQLDEVLRRLSR